MIDTMVIHSKKLDRDISIEAVRIPEATIPYYSIVLDGVEVWRAEVEYLDVLFSVIENVIRRIDALEQ